MLANNNRIPVYQFYTALSQVLSRLCHEVPTIVNMLIDLIARIFEAYPLQTVWFLIPLNDVSFFVQFNILIIIINCPLNYFKI